MAIGPGKKINLGVGTLNKADPSPFDEATLKQQLENIGLSCKQLTDENLRNYIATVRSELPTGIMQAYAIKAPLSSPTAKNVAPQRVAAAMRTAPTGNVLALAANVERLADVAKGNWTLSGDAQGYAPQLEVIQYPTHFSWLYDNRATNGFTGVRQQPPAYSGNYSNAESIQKLFVSVSWNASAALVKGLDQSSMQAMLSNVIQPLANANLENYNVSDSRTVFLVDNYNTSTGYADAIGVLFVQWTLKITDWKRKDKDGGDTHPTNLTISAGAVSYSDTTVLCAQYNAVLKQFGIDPSTAPACKP